MLSEVSKKMLSLSFVLLVLLSLSGCGKGVDGAATSDHSKEPIKIGLVLGMTGPGSDSGQGYLEGAKLAVEDANRKKITDRPIELVVEDSASDPKNAVTAMKKMVSADGVKLFASTLSSHGLVLKPVAIENKVLLFSDAAHPNITGGYDLIFRHSNTADDEAQQIASYLISSRMKSVGILAVQDEYGVSFGTQLKKLLETAGIKTTLELFDVKTNDLRTEIGKMSGTESIVLGGYGPAIPIAVKQVKELGYPGQVVIGVAFPIMGLESLGRDVDGVYHTDYQFKTSDKYAAFSKSYRAVYDKDPKIYPVISYGTLELLINAIAKAGSDDPAAVGKALHSMQSFEGTYETMKINEKGDVLFPVTAVKFDFADWTSKQEKSDQLVPNTPTKKINTSLEPLKIGAIYGITGSGSIFGEEYRNGASLAVDEINAAGGINGRKVELLIEDSQSDPKTGITAFTKLVSIDRVQAVTSHLSGVTMPILPLALDQDVLYLADASHPKVTQTGNPRIFRHQTNAGGEGEMEAIFASNFSRIAVLYGDEEYARAIKDRFQEVVPKDQVITYEPFDNKGSDFRTQIDKVLALKPDLVIVDGIGPAFSIAVKQVREAQYSGPVLASAGFSISGTAKAGAIIDGVYYLDIKGFDASIPAVADFVKRYTQRFGIEPHWAGFAYGDMQLIAAAVRQSGSVEPEVLAKTLHAMKTFNGTIEDMSISENGEVPIALTIRQFKAPTEVETK